MEEVKRPVSNLSNSVVAHDLDSTIAQTEWLLSSWISKWCKKVCICCEFSSVINIQLSFICCKLKWRSVVHSWFSHASIALFVTSNLLNTIICVRLRASVIYGISLILKRSVRAKTSRLCCQSPIIWQGREFDAIIEL